MVEFTGECGYKLENERANNTFVKGNMYKLTHGIIYGYSTVIYIEGFEGSRNNILFDAPLKIIGEWDCMIHDYKRRSLV